MTLKFGTSGIRGLVSELTDYECYLFARSFLTYTQTQKYSKDLYIAGDYRKSTTSILKAIIKAAIDENITPHFCGFIPTPALMYFAINNSAPSIMITGSHIPADRNGIKFNLPTGEILKTDEKKIIDIYNHLKQTIDNSIFDETFSFKEKINIDRFLDNNILTSKIKNFYLNRYKNYFKENGLIGRRIIIYEHSTVARELLDEILNYAGAEIIKFGYSSEFIAVDTEALEDTDLLKEQIIKNKADALVSADGDGDRPLVLSNIGNQLRGDILGLISAKYLNAEAVALPVSCNTAIELSNFFKQTFRTRIGSPFVIETMLLQKEKYKHLVGFEANGGFLTVNNIITNDNKILNPLLTRDAILPILSVLYSAAADGCQLSELLKSLPQRYTDSGILRNYNISAAQILLEELNTKQTITKFLNKLNLLFENIDAIQIKQLDFTDGIRITLRNDEIIHLRPSGNAPEFRCYTESTTINRAQLLKEKVLELLHKKLYQ